VKGLILYQKNYKVHIANDQSSGCRMLSDTIHPVGAEVLATYWETEPKLCKKISGSL
jgi:hypothetical protein